MGTGDLEVVQNQTEQLLSWVISGIDGLEMAGDGEFIVHGVSDADFEGQKAIFSVRRVILAHNHALKSVQCRQNHLLEVPAKPDG
jgi:hypothetical protein